MRKQPNRELLATAAGSLVLLFLTPYGLAEAGSTEVEIETSRALCSRMCDDFPKGSCGVRFIPHQPDGDYGQCQTVYIDRGTGAPAPSNATATPPAANAPANQGSSTLGSKTGSGGFMKHLKVSKDPEFGRKVDEGLGAKPHTSSGDVPLGQ